MNETNLSNADWKTINNAQHPLTNLNADVTSCLPVVPNRYSSKHQQQLLLKLFTHYVRHWVSDVLCEVKQRVPYVQSTSASDLVPVTIVRLSTHLV